MAILQGFPPSNTIGAGTRITEKDLSFVPAETRFNNAGLVGFATKGPINVPTLVTSTRQLHQIFGFPEPTLAAPYLIYAAEQYLSVGNNLWVLRVGETDTVSNNVAATAEVDIPTAGGAVKIISNAADPYSFSVDTMFRWRLNGILSQKTLVVLADANRPSPDTGNAYTVSELVDALNDQLTSEDGITFYENSSNSKIALKSTFSFGPGASIELVSVKDALYGPVVAVNSGTGIRTLTNPDAGLGLNMLPAQVVGTEAMYPDNSYQTAGHFNFSGLTSLTINIVVDGTDSVNIDSVVQTINVTAANYTTLSLVTAINSYIAAHLPGGFKAYKSGNNVAFTTLHSGRDARLLVKSSSSLATALGLSTTTVSGSGDEAVTGDSDTYAASFVTGSESDSTTIMTFKADSPGTSGNKTQVVVKNNIREGNFSIEVYLDGVQVETWGNLVRDESDRLYVESFIALVSNYIRVTDVTSVTGLPSAGTYDLDGGTDGVPDDADDQDALVIGSDVTGTGIQAFSEPEQIDIDLVATPGFSSTAVVTALLSVCASRQDCLAIIDPPFGFTVEEIVAWQNGVHTLNGSRFDSDFGALYYPWVKVRDTQNRIDVWVPPSGSVLATFVRSDDFGAPWMAPAGLGRGVVPNILDVYNKSTSVERDLMYGFRNAINPIVQFPGVDGFVIWGQKTLQRKPTALDRVNVRRLMFYLEKRIRAGSRTLLFEPHDAILRRRFIGIADSILSTVKTLRGLNDYVIKCDEELNTPDVVDRNELRARIGVQPIRAAEFIFIEFSIHRTGSFTENADTF